MSQGKKLAAHRKQKGLTQQQLGELPEGATVTITGGEDGKGNATSLGKYNVQIVISHPDYVTTEANIYIHILTSGEYNGFVDRAELE